MYKLYKYNTGHSSRTSVRLSNLGWQRTKLQGFEVAQPGQKGLTHFREQSKLQNQGRLGHC